MDINSSSAAAPLFILLMFIAIYGIVLLISIAWAVLVCVAHWKLFEKAGESGWKALIPYYNTFKIAQIATGNNLIGWLTVGACAVYFVITIVMQVVIIAASYDDVVYSIVMVLFSVVSMVFSLGVAGLSGYTNFMLGKSFGKPTVWNVLMIFFSPFLTIAMGFDKKLTYIGPKGESSNYGY